VIEPSIKAVDDMGFGSEIDQYRAQYLRAELSSWDVYGGAG